MTKDQLKEIFNPGDIIFFRDVPENPGYHYSYAARALNYFQSWFEVGDSSVIHVGLAHSFNDEPAKPGDTDLLIIDAMPPTGNDKGGVDLRPLVRKYAIEVFRLKDNPVLAKTALDIAMQFRTTDYSLRHCGETLTHKHVRGNAELNEFYTQHLVRMHLFNAQTKTIEPDTLTGGMNCSEFVITCYQLAYLKLGSFSAVDEVFPEFIRLHAHTSPAQLHDFISSSEFYTKLDDASTRALKHSGTPRPEDTLAIVPYTSPPIPAQANQASWGEWLWSYAWGAWNMLPALRQPAAAPQPEAIEMRTAVINTLLHQGHFIGANSSTSCSAIMPKRATHD
jgi:hypothetical protein